MIADSPSGGATADLSAREWEHVLSERFLPGRVIVDGDGSGGRVLGDVGIDSLRLAHLSAGRQSITHTARHLAALTAERRVSVIAHVVIEGGGYIEQAGARLPFAAGDISFRSLGEPSRVVFQAPSRFYALCLPATVVRVPTGGRDPFAGRVARGRADAADAASRLVSGLVERGGAPSIADFHIARALPWLFAAAYHGDSAGPVRRAGNEWRWGRALDHVERHLFDADALLPASCARAIGISERYLHRLFAQRGHRFSRFVMDRRLDAARGLLGCAGNGLSIASVAYQCGFLDPAHFSRLFKRRYGLSPRDYRAVSATRSIQARAAWDR